MLIHSPALDAAADRRRPVWELADRVHINAAYSGHVDALWLSRSRLADLLRHAFLPLALRPAAVFSLRHRGRRLAVSEMPVGSLGMEEGVPPQPYEVFRYDLAGRREVYVRAKGPDLL